MGFKKTANNEVVNFGLTDAVTVIRQDKSCVTSATSVRRRTFRFTLLRSAASVNLSRTVFCNSTSSRRTPKQFQKNRYLQNSSIW